MTQPREMTHPRTKVVLQSRQFSSSSSTDTPHTKVVLPSRQFSASSSTDTPRTKVELQSRQFSASSSPSTPRSKVVLQSRQFSASSSPGSSAYHSCAIKSAVLSLRLARLLRALKLYYKVASSQPPAPQPTPHTKVVLQSHQFSACTWRFTKCCACHEICTSSFTNGCGCHEVCTWSHELCAWR